MRKNQLAATTALTSLRERKSPSLDQVETSPNGTDRLVDEPILGATDPISVSKTTTEAERLFATLVGAGYPLALSIPQGCALIGSGRTTAYQLRKQGKLPFRKEGRASKILLIDAARYLVNLQDQR